MDLLTIERIKLMHPFIREEVLKDYNYINNSFLEKNIRLRFTQTYRNFKEQDELFKTGRNKPGKIITNAKGGLSIHNYGLAFDIAFLLDKDKNGTFETVSWDNKSNYWIETVKHFKKSGWMWGGDWKSFPDYPHFEKTFGMTPKQLLSKYNSGDTFNEIIDGKTYKWINL